MLLADKIEEKNALAVSKIDVLYTEISKNNKIANTHKVISWSIILGLIVATLIVNIFINIINNNSYIELSDWTMMIILLIVLVGIMLHYIMPYKYKQYIAFHA